MPALARTMAVPTKTASVLPATMAITAAILAAVPTMTDKIVPTMNNIDANQNSDNKDAHRNSATLMLEEKP